MGGMLINNTLCEIISNMIPNYTYSTNEKARTVCKKVDVFGRNILESEIKFRYYLQDFLINRYCSVARNYRNLSNLDVERAFNVLLL